MLKLSKHDYVKTCRLSFCRECSGLHNTLCHLPTSKDSGKSEESRTQADNGQSRVNVAVHHASTNERERCVFMATAMLEA